MSTSALFCNGSFCTSTCALDLQYQLIVHFSTFPPYKSFGMLRMHFIEVHLGVAETTSISSHIPFNYV